MHAFYVFVVDLELGLQLDIAIAKELVQPMILEMTRIVSLCCLQQFLQNVLATLLLRCQNLKCKTTHYVNGTGALY